MRKRCEISREKRFRENQKCCRLVSNARGFYLRAIASPVNSSQFRAIVRNARNSTQLRAIQEQLRAIPHSCAQRNSYWKPYLKWLPESLKSNLKVDLRPYIMNFNWLTPDQIKITDSNSSWIWIDFKFESAVGGSGTQLKFIKFGLWSKNTNYL